MEIKAFWNLTGKPRLRFQISNWWVWIYFAAESLLWPVTAPPDLQVALCTGEPLPNSSHFCQSERFSRPPSSTRVEYLDLKCPNTMEMDLGGGSGGVDLALLTERSRHIIQLLLRPTDQHHGETPASQLQTDRQTDRRHRSDLHLRAAAMAGEPQQHAAH